MHLVQLVLQHPDPLPRVDVLLLLAAVNMQETQACESLTSLALFAQSQ